MATGGSNDNLVKIFEVATGKELRSFDTGAGATFTIGFSGDGRYVVASHADNSLRAWSAADGSPAKNIAPAVGYVKNYNCSSDGRLLAYPLPGGNIAIVDLSTWATVRTLEGGPFDYVAFHPRGRYLAATGADGSVKAWDFTTGKLVSTLATQVGSTSRLSFAADGFTLVVAGSDGLIRHFGLKK